MALLVKPLLRDAVWQEAVRHGEEARTGGAELGPKGPCRWLSFVIAGHHTMKHLFLKPTGAQEGQRGVR